MSALLVPAPIAPDGPDDLPTLLAAVAVRDPIAFTELYRRTVDRVESVVARTVGVPHLVADVVQDVYLQVWEKAIQYDPRRSSVLSWLSMLAHRRAVDRVRLEVSSVARDAADAGRGDVAEPDIGDQAALRVDAGRVRSQLWDLSDVQREAVVVTYLKAYSHRQAAQLLTVPLGTFKSRVRDGLLALRRLAEAG